MLRAVGILRLACAAAQLVSCRVSHPVGGYALNGAERLDEVMLGGDDACVGQMVG